MKRFARNKKGQFIIIAVLLVSIMIVSIGALLHTAATYYKHEPWEEYSTVISDIELNTRRLLQISLVDYTRTNNSNVLNNSLTKWQSDLSKIYPEKGITLDFNLTTGSTTIYGQPLTFSQGLATKWTGSVGSSSAMANFTITIKSIGLAGYKFTAEAFMKLVVTEYDPISNRVVVVVYGENNIPISDLKKDNFKVNSLPIINMTSQYNPTFAAITYAIYYQGVSPPVVEVTDYRGIRVVANQQ